MLHWVGTPETFSRQSNSLRQHGHILTGVEEGRAIHKYWSAVFDSRSLPEQVWRLEEFITFSEEEVLEALCKLPAHKAAAPNRARAILWKVCAEEVTPEFTKLANRLVQKGDMCVEARQPSCVWER